MNCGYNSNLDITLKSLHHRYDSKIEKFPSSLPSLTTEVDWRERDDESGLECEVCVVTLSGLKVKEGGFRVKFVKVCE